MRDMNHSDAVRLQAAEKYVLGELQGSLRDEYEEHYFDCAECAADLKATAAFVSMSRMAFRNEAAVAPQTVAALALAVVTVHQSTVTIPNLQKSTSLAATGTSTQTLELGASATRRGSD